MGEGKFPRRRGAPPGNQNARKHGFYSTVLTGDELVDLAEAVDVEGLDEEIALMRVKLKAVMRNDPENTHLIMEAVKTLSRLVCTRYNISRTDKKGLKEAVATVLKDIALPLGLGIGEVIAHE